MDPLHCGAAATFPTASGRNLGCQSPAGFMTRRIRAPDPVSDAQLAAIHRRLGVPKNYAHERALERKSEPAGNELVSVASSADRDVRLVQPAAMAWRKMHEAAARDGVVLLPLSGFRSVARQAEIIEAKLTRGLAIHAILAVNAAPGYSEHHTGRAIDIGTPGEPPLERTFALCPAFAWLSAHAVTFGFVLTYPENNPHGVIYEPWHWCWRL